MEDKPAPHCDRSRLESLFKIVYIDTDIVATAVDIAALSTVFDL